VRIKTLIRKLQAIEEKHGNIEVHIDHDLSPMDDKGQINNGGHLGVDFVKVIPYHYHRFISHKPLKTKLIKKTICNISWMD